MLFESQKLGMMFVIILFILLNHYSHKKHLHSLSNKNEPIFLINNFLSDSNFMIIKELMLSHSDNINKSSNFMRKGSAISHYKMRKNKLRKIIDILDRPSTLLKIYNKTGLNVQFVPKIDNNYLSLVMYVDPGDNINWHYDGNIYHGKRWAGILTIVNQNNNGGYSTGKFNYRKNVYKYIKFKEFCLIFGPVPVYYNTFYGTYRIANFL